MMPSVCHKPPPSREVMGSRRHRGLRNTNGEQSLRAARPNPSSRASLHLKSFLMEIGAPFLRGRPTGCPLGIFPGHQRGKTIAPPGQAEARREEGCNTSSVAEHRRGRQKCHSAVMPSIGGLQRAANVERPLNHRASSTC